MATHIADINAALNLQLSITPLGGIDIAWQNRQYKPSLGNPFVEQSIIPLKTTGTMDEDLTQGIYHLNIYVPTNAGHAKFNNLADAIADSFPSNAKLVYNSVEVIIKRVTVRELRKSLKYGQGWAYQPVEIDFLSMNPTR